MPALARAGQVFLVLFGLITIVFMASVYASDDPFPSDANALIASAGVSLGVVYIALATVGLASRQMWAWATLWIGPALMAAHVALLGIWIPDGVFFVLLILALIATKPNARVYASPA
jgi:hypothetical protein